MKKRTVNQISKKTQRGGPRPGAGRPAKDTAAYKLMLSPKNRQWLEAESERLGCTMSDVVNRLIEGQS